MAQTITSGVLATDGFTVRPVGGITWTDLDSSPYASWENWTSWTSEATNIVVSETVDTGRVDYYLPLAEVLTEGDLTITVDVSDTGLFAGEEATYDFTTANVGQTLIKGRHFRWNFTVAPTANQPIPYLQYFVQANNSPVNIYLDDVVVPELPTDSLGFRVVDHPLGAVKNVQATTLQGDDYWDYGYVSTYSALDSYVRTANTSLVTVDGTPSYVDGYKPRHSKAIKFNGVDQALEFNNSTGSLMSGYPFTIEFLFKVPPISPSDNRAAGRKLLHDTILEGIPNTDLSIRIAQGDSASDSEIIVQVAGLINAQRTHTPFPIEGNRWYHYSISFTSATSFRSVVATLDGENSGTGPGEGPGDVIETTASDFGYDSEIPELFFLGKYDLYGDSRDYEDWEDVEIDEFRITDGEEKNATDYWISPGYVVTPFVSEPNTTMLLHFDDSIEDDTLVRTGTEDYTLQQQGGTAVVEQKNPLSIKVVDYNGDPWDGAVDLALRGLPKIARRGNSLVSKYD